MNRLDEWTHQFLKEYIIASKESISSTLSALLGEKEGIFLTQKLKDISSSIDPSINQDIKPFDALPQNTTEQKTTDKKNQAPLMGLAPQIYQEQALEIPQKISKIPFINAFLKEQKKGLNILVTNRLAIDGFPDFQQAFPDVSKVQTGIDMGNLLEANLYQNALKDKREGRDISYLDTEPLFCQNKTLAYQVYAHELAHWINNQKTVHFTNYFQKKHKLSDANMNKIKERFNLLFREMYSSNQDNDVLKYCRFEEAYCHAMGVILPVKAGYSFNKQLAYKSQQELSRFIEEMNQNGKAYLSHPSPNQWSEIIDTVVSLPSLQTQLQKTNLALNQQMQAGGR